MFKFLTVAITFLSLVSLQSPDSQQQSCDFSQYVVKYDKDYQEGTTEYQTHRDIFNANCELINAHNSDPQRTFSLEVNQFTDLAPLDMPNHDVDRPQLTEQSDAVEPTHVGWWFWRPPKQLDYRQQGKVSPVKNQGSCGSCVHFATIGMYESLLLMENKKYILSEQANLQCTSRSLRTSFFSSCAGGRTRDGLDYVGQFGAVQASKYPYISANYGGRRGFPQTSGICMEKQRIMVGQGRGVLYRSMSEQSLKNLLKREGPVVVHVNAEGTMPFYKRGIFRGCPSRTHFYQLGHAVLLVGYNDEGGYWIAKNSWGTMWGENGFIRIDYNRNCGVTLYPGHLRFSRQYSNEHRQLVFSRTGLNTQEEDEHEHANWKVGFIVVLVLLTVALILFAVYCRLSRKANIKPEGSQVGTNKQATQQVIQGNCKNRDVQTSETGAPRIQHVPS